MLDPDDHVGVDVRREQGGGEAGQAVEGPHGQVRPTSTIAPAIAAAAATAGLARWVRAPGPWRPTKLRFEVETLRLPGGTRSPLKARHMEQPGSRHWKPASLKIRSSPSASAWRFTFSEPGTTHAVTLPATLRPLATSAAARRSERRLLVQEPMNTQSTGVPAI